MHTFTPAMKGQERMADVGLLYDPSSKSEKQFCGAWGKACSRYWESI